MKFLDAMRKAANLPGSENKMMPGSRSDQDGSDSTPPAIGEDIIALAKQLNVDLSTVKGTGRDGKILARDVRRTAEAVVTKAIPISGQSRSEN